MTKTFKPWRFKSLFIVFIFIVGIFACSGPAVDPKGNPSLSFPGEERIGNLRQLTSGGTNAEAYWSFDGRWLAFQHKGPGLGLQPEAQPKCDQIYAIKADGSEVRKISNGLGRTTCSYFYPDDSRILFSSTFATEKECPAEPDMSQGYVWPIYPSYQFFAARPDGTDIIPIEPGAPRAYNAEATVCKDGSVVFTSDRDGDLELYVARLDRSGVLTNIKRITHTLGYDGGAFFSQDCKKLVWRTSRPRSGKETEDYIRLLKKHLVRPGRLEIWTADADGSHARQVTAIGAATFAPSFTPDGKKILFSSNPRDPRGRQFDLYLIDTNGTRLEQVTYSGTFDSFPLFSPDGKHLAFSSNRNASRPRETNVFIADWIEAAPTPISVDDHSPANRYQACVEKLSVPEMEGRGVGTAGLKKAEDFIAEQFQKIGIKPIITNDFKHPVAIQTGVSIDEGQTWLESPKLGKLKINLDFIPASFSSSTEFSSSVVNAGYGIIAPELKINDYEKVDVQGRIALVRRHIPKDLKLSSAQERSYSDLRYKTFLAREKGAKAVVFWDPEEGLPKLGNGNSLSSQAGIPVVFVSGPIGKSLASQELTGKISLNRKTDTTHNILGTLGGGCGRAPAVVIGAHLDHLGHGASTSLEPSKSGIHYGADDNASGIAALFEIARIIKTGKPDLLKKSCFVFAAFTGEEIGIAGSSHVVDLLKSKHLNPKAMLNLDMVGRLENNKLIAFGTDSAQEWNKIVKEECASRLLECPGGGDGYGPSDHMPFYIAGIPVLHFFTGPHEDYHRTTDTAEKINATGGVQIAETVAAIAMRIAPPGERLRFQKAKGTSSIGALRSGDRKSFGGYLGTIPDYSAMSSPNGPGGDKSQGGVKLAGARSGSPAEKAGIKPGDILTGIEEHTEDSAAKTQEIHSLEDFMYILTGLKPEQKIVLRVRRGDQIISLPAVVGKRE